MTYAQHLARRDAARPVAQVPLDETVEATAADIAVATAIVSHQRGYAVKLPSQAHYATQAVARHALASQFPAFKPMHTWDKRDEIVLLLVDYAGDDAAHATDDANVAVTIGHNNDHNVGEGEGSGWQFAGWCWSHDHYTQGVGQVIGWLPLSGFHSVARSLDTLLYPKPVAA